MEIKKTVLKVSTSLTNYIENNPECISKAMNIWSENRKISTELKKIELYNSKEILAIIHRYELFRDILTQIFAERQTALNYHYQALDKALHSEDRELIVESLRGISTIISKNPLENFVEFSKILENEDETLKLDF